MESTGINVYRIDDTPYGITYEQWCIEWWRWLLSFPKSTNPACDEDGSLAKHNQFYPNVYFLCQTMEKSHYVPNREVTIPIGVKIFLPIINWISVKVDGQSEKEMIDLAKMRIDSVGRLQVKINNEELDINLWSNRVRPPPFEVELPEDNLLEEDSGIKTLVTDGYWIFFEPLTHEITLSTSGACSLGITEIGVKYRIKLE